MEPVLLYCVASSSITWLSKCNSETEKNLYWTEFQLIWTLEKATLSKNDLVTTLAMKGMPYPSV